MVEDIEVRLDIQEAQEGVDVLTEALGVLIEKNGGVLSVGC